MIDEDINNIITINELIRRKEPFAVYRIPGEKHPCLLTQTAGEIRLIYHLEELNNQRGFVIAPFRVDKKSPVVLIQPNRIHSPFPLEGELEPDYFSGSSSFSSDSSLTSCTEEYAGHFRTFLTALREERFDKLVLSRPLGININKVSEFSPARAFQAACRRYIHSYVYLCYTPQTGVWMGSTPEILLSGEKKEWNTVALAGTQPLQDGKLPHNWNEKNREEQEYVASYIRRQLLSLGIHPEEKGPYPAYAGALSHLKTDFHFSLKNNEGLGDLLNLLHPTPAVCGLPKKEAYQFIMENEGYDRSYYTGFIGWINPDGRTDLYVNLRCMHVEESQLTLYAGGGLLASSELSDEWQETEKKLQTMKRIINT